MLVPPTSSASGEPSTTSSAAATRTHLLDALITAPFRCVLARSYRNRARAQNRRRFRPVEHLAELLRRQDRGGFEPEAGGGAVRFRSVERRRLGAAAGHHHRTAIGEAAAERGRSGFRAALRRAPVAHRA